MDAGVGVEPVESRSPPLPRVHSAETHDSRGVYDITIKRDVSRLYIGRVRHKGASRWICEVTFQSLGTNSLARHPEKGAMPCPGFAR